MEEETKNEIFEYLDSISPNISTEDELKIHFEDILNVVDTSEDTGEETPSWDSLKFQCEESECWYIFHEYIKGKFTWEETNTK